jgi:serine/threonine protein kinase
MVDSRRNKKYMRKTRKTSGSKQYRGTNVTNLDETFRGKNFFRKYGASITETAICKILKKNPHPNIVKVYRITDSYIDIELLTPINSEKNYDKNTLISEALLVKKFLQNLGIMYIDWKPDNMGIGADGKYKLFDFDLSGITCSPLVANTTKKYLKSKGILHDHCKTNKKWRMSPSTLNWTYRQALANGLKDPKEIDDFAFDINFIRKNYVELNNSDIPTF